MTAVNWERMVGEQVEELAAALLLSTRPGGNRVTPSRGDKGIDIRIPSSDGWHVYQVKRHTRRLNSTQAKDVEQSWRTFLDEGVPLLSDEGIASWNLVMPWDPTNERLTWLKQMTSGQDFGVEWLGRTHLDVMAADHRQLVAYYQGDGADRVQELMAQAIIGGAALPPDMSGQPLLDAVIHRQQALADALDDVDPYYRYVVEVRPGPLSGHWADTAVAGDKEATLVVYRQIDEDHHAALKIIANSAMSNVFHPIEHRVRFDVTDPYHRDQVERFRQYGAPLDEVPAIVVSSSGPPGARIPEGAMLAISVAAVHTGQQLDLELELRALDAAGTTVAVLPLENLQVSRGITGPGLRVVGSDGSKSIHVEALLDQSAQSELIVKLSSLAGKRATRALPAATFMGGVRAGTQLQLAIAGGLPVTAPWIVDYPGDGDRDVWARFVRALTVVQAHTYSEVRVPEELSRGLYDEVTRAARLLNGEVLTTTLSETSVVVTDPAAVTATEFAAVYHRTLAIEVEGKLIETDRVERIQTPRARLVGDLPVREGDRIRIVFDEPASAYAVPIAAADLSS